MKKLSGFGLVEILISLLLASFILLGTMQYYLHAKRYYLTLQDALEQHFDLRLITALLRDSIKRAGFTPCLSINHLVGYDNRKNQNNLVGIQVETAPLLALHINRMSEYYDLVQSIPTEKRINITHQTTLNPLHPVIIADCYHAEVHEVERIAHTKQTQTLTLTKPLMYRYKEPVYVGEWLEEFFFVRQGPHKAFPFYYRLNRTEELSHTIRLKDVQLEYMQEAKLVQVILSTGERKEERIETRVRAP